MATKSMRDRIREQAQAATTEGASYLKLTKRMSFFSPKADEYELDVIPFENSDGDLEALARFKVHSGIGAEDLKYICPTSIGKKCPICEERARMNKSANADPDLIKALAPKDRTLIQVIDLKEEKKGIQLFEHSYFLFGKKLLSDIEKSEHSTGKRKRSTAHAGFAELQGGQTLIASFIEKKMGSNKFYECDRIDAEDRDDYEESILDDTQNLYDCLKVLDYAALEAIFLELEPEEQGSSRVREEKKEEKSSRRSSKYDEDEDEAPKRSRGRKEEVEEEAPPVRRRGKVEESKEEEVEEAPKRRRSAAKEEVAEEAVEAPVSRRSKKAEVAVEEEVEEAPVTRRSRSKAVEEEAPKGKCYVKGGVFGKDCDKHTDDAPNPNCYDCPEDTWKACKEEQIRLSK